jgi:membrane protease YdiL (CAAX protease family)
MVVLSKIDVAGVDGKAIATPDVWEGLLASIGAGIREEVWLRFGVLTFCVWVGLKFARRLPPHGEMPSSRLLWTANIVAALGFAAMHVPQAQMLIGLTGRLLVFMFVGNGVPGLVFGWLYWRRGLVPAMAAHFGLDLVLKVLVPLVS